MHTENLPRLAGLDFMRRGRKAKNKTVPTKKKLDLQNLARKMKDRANGQETRCKHRNPENPASSDVDQRQQWQPKLEQMDACLKNDKFKSDSDKPQHTVTPKGTV